MLNKITQRAVNFWSTMYRLAKSLEINPEELNKKIIHNYNFIKHRTVQKKMNTDINTMNNLKECYDTGKETCF